MSAVLITALNIYCLFLSEYDWKLQSFTNYIKPLSHLWNRTYNFNLFFWKHSVEWNIAKEKDLSLEECSWSPFETLTPTCYWRIGLLLFNMHIFPGFCLINVSIQKFSRVKFRELDIWRCVCDSEITGHWILGDSL